jgi:hypothetical protein
LDRANRCGLAVAHWAATAGKTTDWVGSALFFGGAALAHGWRSCPAPLMDFLPTGLRRLPLLIASEEDPYLPIEIVARR